MFLQPPESDIGHSKSDHSADPDSNAIEDRAQMHCNQTAEQCTYAKANGREQCAIEVFKIVKENDLRVHQEQDKISGCHHGINPHNHACIADSREENHKKQVDHD